MAEKRVIEVQVNTSSAVKSVDNLTKSNTDLSASFEDVYGEIQPLSGRMGELEDRLYELALAGKKNTQEYKDLVEQVGKFKKTIQDTDRVVDAAAVTTGEKLGGALNGAIAGFQTFQGGLGLIGVESGEVEAALLKVQSAMALTEGVKGIREALPSIQAFGKTAINAFKGISGAIAATGIGVLLIAVGALVANWDKLTSAISKTSATQKSYNETAEDYKKGAAEAVKVTNEVKTSFDLAKKGVISKEEALKTYNEKLGDTFGTATSLNEAEELYNQKTEAYIKATALRARATALFAKAAEKQVEGITAELEDQTSFFDKVSFGFSNYFSSTEEIVNKANTLQKKRVKEKKKSSEEEAKLFTDLASKDLESAIKLEESNNIKGKSDKSLEDERKKLYEEAKKRREEELKRLEEQRQKEAEIERARILNIKQLREEFYASLEQAETDYYNSKLSAQELDIQNTNDYFFNLIEQAKQYGEDTTILEQANKDKISEINDKYAKEAADKQKAIDDKLATDREAQNKKELDDANLLKQQKLQAVQDTFTTIANLAELFQGKNEKINRKAFQVQKAANIANATIDTYKSATSAYSSLAAVPVVGPALGIAAAAAAITAGFINVKKIASTQYGATSASGGSTGSSSVSSPNTGGSISAPTFNVVGNAGANPLQNLGQPIKAYVVSNDVTSAQSLDRNIIKNATL